MATNEVRRLKLKRKLVKTESLKAESTKKAAIRITPKKRSRNWSDQECITLVNGVIGEQHRLFGNFSNKLTNSDKWHIWKKISEDITA
jgi:hypothetical protein